MLYLIIVIFSIIVALLRGGELERLSNLSLTGTYIFIVALVLRGLLWIAELFSLNIFYQYSPIILIVSYMLLLFAVFKNINLAGFRYISLGILLNAFVIMVNSGKMPVKVDEVIVQYTDKAEILTENNSIIYLINNSKSFFTFLGDVIPLPGPLPQTSILSAGDIIIFIGLFVLIQKSMTEDTAI